MLCEVCRSNLADNSQTIGATNSKQLPYNTSTMAESGQPQQTSPSPTQASKNSAAPTINEKKRSLAAVITSTKYDILPPGYKPAAMASTKYDVLSPLSKADDPSIQSASSAMAKAHPLPATPTIPSALLSAVRYSAECLAAARTKLAAQKEATTASASKPSEDASKQVFEVTKVKTIKCDICSQKNTDLLYKCKNCFFHHQICSRCVESNDPKASAGRLGKRDWSFHAKLKDAHASYKLPVCLGRMEDGSYEDDDVRFFVAQRRRDGTKKDKKTNPKGGVKSSDRNARVSRATVGSKTTEQGRRIAEAAKAKFDRSMSTELGGRVEAARARMNGEEDEVAAQGRKRKADVLDEDEDEDEDGAPALKKATAENTGE